jgi:hypothetical protein
MNVRGERTLIFSQIIKITFWQNPTVYSTNKHNKPYRTATTTALISKKKEGKQDYFTDIVLNIGYLDTFILRALLGYYI